MTNKKTVRKTVGAFALVIKTSDEFMNEIDEYGEDGAIAIFSDKRDAKRYSWSAHRVTPCTITFTVPTKKKKA